LQIERKIEKSEEEVRKLNTLLEDPTNCEQLEKLSEICKKIQLLETQIEQLYLRWEQLDNKKNS
jgi:predicted RNase H-like nuclease (RuvC/YqgF family)